MIQKATLQKFIEKYNLAGTADAVLWETTATGTTTKFVSDDKNVVGEISSNELKLPIGTYAIYETAQLKNLLAVLGENITIDVVSKNSANRSFTISDSDVKTTFCLSDPINIPAAPSIKKFPVFELTITLDKPFIDRYLKSIVAIKDSAVFTVKSDGKIAEVIVGYSKSDTNRVSITTDAPVIAPLDPIHFHAKYMKEILNVNKDAVSGTLEVSSKGLARITFILPEFSITYYLPQMAQT